MCRLNRGITEYQNINIRAFIKNEVTAAHIRV